MGGGASKNVYSRTQGDDKGLDMVCDCVGADEATVIKFCEDFKEVAHEDVLNQAKDTLATAAKTFATGRCTQVLNEGGEKGVKRRKLADAMNLLERVGLTEEALVPCLTAQIKRARSL